MMTPRASFRGGPLIALCAVLCLWIAARVALAPYDSLPGDAGLAPLPIPVAAAEAPPPSHPVVQPVRRAVLTRPHAFTPPPSQRLIPMPSSRPVSAIPVRPQPGPFGKGSPVGMAAGHNALWMAALSRLPLPAGLAAMREAAPSPVPFYPAGRTPANVDKRWTSDGWLLLRSGGAAALGTGAAPATYGASQMGAVLRYRIAPTSTHRPEAYLRAATALGRGADKELALGISARLLPTVPLRAALELRASDQPGGQQVRPAAMVVTEIRPIDLPYGTRAEFYAQAGYVGGKFATSFADGQARIDTPLGSIGDANLRAGAGAWAGAQKGAARVDIGPTATVGVPIGGGGSARLALDWRMRVAGNAEPGSGPALTLSAGF